MDLLVESIQSGIGGCMPRLMQGSPTERVACYRGEFRQHRNAYDGNGEYEFPDNPPLCPAILARRRAPLLLSGLSHVETSTAFLLRLTVVAVFRFGSRTQSLVPEKYR